MRVLGVGRFWMDAAPVVDPLRFRRAPMLFAAMCFALGDLFARRWHTPLSLVLMVITLLALALFSLRKYPRVALWPALGLWIAAGCWCAHMQPALSQQHELKQFADGLNRTVQGRTVRIRKLRAKQIGSDGPEHTSGSDYGEATPTLESVDLQVNAVEYITSDIDQMRAVSGGVRVAITGGEPALHCGDVLELPLRMHTPEVYRDPGAWSYADDLLRQGIGVQANIKAAQVRRISGSKPTWQCRFNAAQLWASERVQALVNARANRWLPAIARLGAEDTAMLQAMLFGNRAMLTHPLRVGFERTGTFHLFVVSGLHVAIVAGGLFWLFRKARLPESWAVAATIVASGGYAMLTGFGTPVQRAWLMSSAFLIARLFGRERSALNALGAAALAVLALDPRSLFESSFQMTMLVIVAIAGVAVPLEQRWFATWRGATHELWVVRLDAALSPATAQLRVRLRMWGSLCAKLIHRQFRDLPLWCLRALHWLLAALLFGLCTEICMMLPMAVYFHRATVLALPLNAICIPLVAVLLCAAITTFCVSLVSTSFAVLPGALTALLLHAVQAVVSRLSHITISDLRVPTPTVASIVVACVCIAFCCWALRANRRVVTIGVCALMIIPIALFWMPTSTVRPGQLEVTAIDVGQGDSLLVVAPNGHTLLVDAGGPVGRSPSANASANQWDVGEEIVAPYLWSRHISRLDAVLLTHAHSDHMGGMTAILRDFHPHELWLSVQPGSSPALQLLLAEAKDLGIRVRWMRAGDVFEWNSLHAQVLSPGPQYINAGAAANDDSLVMRLNYGEASVLLEGDAETPSEVMMLARGLVTPTTLLKVGHHGSKTSTTAAFLAAAAPKNAVISVGSHNTFGHPRFEVLQRLQAAGVKTYRTDRHGAETFLLQSDGGIQAVSAASN